MSGALPFALTVQEAPAPVWRETWKGSIPLLRLADHHYTRQKPGTNQFCRPGVNLCREWGWPPPDGLITAIGVEETKRRRSKRSPPGRCFLEAGWERLPEKDRGGKIWLRSPRPARIVAGGTR